MKFYKFNKSRLSHHLWLKYYRRTYSNQSPANISYLEIQDKSTGESRKIAYERNVCSSQSEVLYIPGLMSHMLGIKAKALHSFCKKNNITYTRYDPCGLGSSNTIHLDKVRLSHWIQDAESILNTNEKPKIVVASSLGSWISLKLCQKYPEKFEALVLLAPGVNASTPIKNRIYELLPKALIERLEKGEVINVAHPEYGICPMSMAFVDDMYKNEIDFSSNLLIPCPVRIIQGTKDVDVPYKQTVDLIEKIDCNDLQVTLIKDAYHRLCTEENLKVISDTVLKLVNKANKKN